MSKKKCWSICLFVTGIIFTIIGIVLLIVVPIIVVNTVNKSVPLTEGSFAEQTWEAPPFAIYFDVWMFNVTNPDEVLQKGAKPSLQEKGPYSFYEKQRKIDINRPDYTNISYQNLIEYFFNPPTSCPTCKEDDLFIVPNVPYLTALSLFNSMKVSDTDRKFLNLALMAIGEHPFVMRDAKSLLFAGYKDQIFSLLQAVKSFFPAFAGYPDRMGFFYPKNASCDGPYVIDSGADNVQDVGRIWLYNGSNLLPYWNSHQANMINGTDGTVYAPFVKKTDTLRLFVSDICRSVYATYYSDTEVLGIKGYRFYIPDSVFNASNPANFGFCEPTTDVYYPKSQIPLPGHPNISCLPSGFLNISKCQFGAPVMVTSPHFLFTPPDVWDTVVGNTPPGDNDLSFLDIEPTSGVLMHVMRKIQLNVAMNRNKDYLMLKYITPVIVPVLFLNESTVMNDAMRSYLYKNVVVLQNLAYGVSYTILALGLLFIVVIGLGFLVLRYRKHQISKEEHVDQQFSEPGSYNRRLGEPTTTIEEQQPNIPPFSNDQQSIGPSDSIRSDPANKDE